MELSKQNLEISKQRNIRRFLIIVCVLTILLATVIYYSYRVKEKGNRQLKEEIDQHQLTSTKLQAAERERFKTRNLESIGVLAGGIAHDFNNLLTVILGNISLAKESGSTDKEQLSLLEQAEKVSMQAANLVNKLLTFSKGDILVKKKVELSALLQEAMALNPVEAQYSIQVHIPEILMPIHGDERQLVQVFSNLVQNAGDAVSEKGTISIRAENTILDTTNKLKLLPGQFVHVSIEDTGIGIPEENIGKIFDPYFSTKAKGVRKGIGIGLAVCYSIIRKHSGHIAVNSSPGKGTLVDLYLPAFVTEPLIIKEEKYPPPPPVKKKPTAKQKINILFMDDEESIIMISQDMLELMGYEVACFQEGSEAVSAYK